MGNEERIYRRYKRFLGLRLMWNFNLKKSFDKVVAWDRTLARKFQDKFNLTDYQMLCVAFAKGVVIGAILL